MRRYTASAVILVASLAISCHGIAIGTGFNNSRSFDRVVGHEAANVEGIDLRRIKKAKDELVVAYWHTSHGSQLVTGISGMDEFYGGKGWYLLNGASGLRLDEQGSDLGNPGLSDFNLSVRSYLANHAETNVVMASWCGQISSARESYIQQYLHLMAALEADFPFVTFVYMTGHSDGSGEKGNLHQRNRQIRDYCETNDKWLFDFYDIECYDPDGEYYGDKLVNDACDYDSDGDGSLEANWAIDWQAANPSAWWLCVSQHSQSLNANLKAKAAWQLWCAIAEER